jgi:hypothetical protein
LCVGQYKENMQTNLQKDIEVVVNCLIANLRKNDDEITPILKTKGLNDSLISSYLLWIPIALPLYVAN